MSNYKSSKLHLYDSTNFSQLFEIKNDLDKVYYTSAGQSEFNATAITFVKKDVSGNTLSQVADVVSQIIETKDGLASEVSTRAIEDGKLETKISNEASTRASEDVKLDGKISDEATVRAVEDGKLDGKISDEASTRASEDVKLDGKISDEVKNRADGDSALDAKINTEKQRIDAIMSGASVNLDTFVEVVNYVNGLDSTQLNLIQNQQSQISALQTQVNALQAVIDSFVPLSGRGN